MDRFWKFKAFRTDGKQPSQENSFGAFYECEQNQKSKSVQFTTCEGEI